MRQLHWHFPGRLGGPAREEWYRCSRRSRIRVWIAIQKLVPVDDLPKVVRASSDDPRYYIHHFNKIAVYRKASTC